MLRAPSGTQGLRLLRLHCTRHAATGNFAESVEDRKPSTQANLCPQPIRPPTRRQSFHWVANEPQPFATPLRRIGCAQNVYASPIAVVALANIRNSAMASLLPAQGSNNATDQSSASKVAIPCLKGHSKKQGKPCQPKLCPIERHNKGQSSSSADFYQNTADICVQSAQAIARLLPEEVKLQFIYETVPVVEHCSPPNSSHRGSLTQDVAPKFAPCT
jgi:hypothetical protein